MSFRSLREKINIKLYDSKNTVLPLLKILNLFVSFGAVAILVYFHGFPQTNESKALINRLIQVSFAFYILSFITRFVYDFEPKAFLKKNRIEAIIMAILAIEGISYNLFNTLILESVFSYFGWNSFANYSTILVQLYFLVIVFVEITRSSGIRILPNFRVHPATIFISSFIFIILGGTGLLMLPEMTVPLGSMNFLDAFFTSTSATCVTGLIVEDTPTFFTFKGQLVILVLIKLGGLNIIAFGSFIALASKFGLGVKQHDVLEDFVNRDSVLSATGMLGKVVIWSIMIEIIGAIVMFFSWAPNIPELENTGDKIFSSIFHSVSAFNNAGLSLFTDGLYNESVRENYLIHINITALVFFGALGFMAIFDLFEIKKLRERIKTPWKTIQFSTKIALYFSIILVVLGTAFYFILERDNTLEDQNTIEAMITSLFQSVTRTSGFNSVDIGSIGAPMLILMLFLMFVGSSSSSTGGGIKTSTFAILWASLIATIRGKKEPELFKRTINNDLVFKAFSVFMFFVAGNLICIFLLAITEHEILAQEGRSVLDLMFEEVSAFGTVGLSTGITADLSPAGKVIIIISMFVGRVGTLTVGYLFGKTMISKNYKYPNGHTMVG